MPKRFRLSSVRGCAIVCRGGFAKSVKTRFSVTFWIGAGLAAATFALYAFTLTPGVPPTDSGELALAAWLPGVAHAPGFPLYVLIGWLWTHLVPFGRVIWRLNLLSAACGALTVGLAYALALRTLRETSDPRGAPLQAAAVGALVLGLGRTVWNWATVSEVYALNLLLTAAILLLVILSGETGRPEGAGPAEQRSRSARERKSRGAAEQGERAGPHGPRLAPLILAAFLFGLGLGNHLTSIALLAPAIAFWLTARRGWRFWISRPAWLAALALTAGLAVYLYLPARAAGDPLLNWGNPDTWQRFWWHVTARQYRVSLFSAPVWPQIIFAAKLWWTQFTPVGLALLVVGAWRMARAQRPLFWMLALIILCTTAYAWAYVIEDDGDAYYLPAFLAASVWVAWGAAAITAWANTAFSGQPVGKPARTRLNPDENRFSGRWPARLLLLIVPILALAMNWPACNRRSDTISEDYVRDAFAEIAANGLLLTRDWQLAAPALYLQQVEGLRPDLTVIDTELLRRDWYFGLLHKVAPELMTAVTTEERAFRTLRDAWERGDLPDGDPRLADLQATYVTMLDALIDRAAATGRPVHIGPNRGAAALRDATLNGRPDMESGVGTSWTWLPVGLSFRAMVPAPAETLDAASLLAPSLQTWHVQPFGRVMLTAPEAKIQATRADMAALRGLVRAQMGDLAGAEADWRVALAVDPTHAPANELMRRLRGGQ